MLRNGTSRRWKPCIAEHCSNKRPSSMTSESDAHRTSDLPDRARTAWRRPVCGALLLATQFLALNTLGLFCTAYIIRRLGARHYGEWATASALATALLIVTNVGLRPIFVRDLARRPEDARDLLAEQVGLRMVLGALAAAFAMAICLVLRYPPVVIACMAVWCVWIMLSVLSSTLGDLLQSFEMFGGFAAGGLVSGLAVTAVSMVVVYHGGGPIGLSIAYLTAPAVNLWLYWRLASRHVRIGVRWNATRAGALLRESRLIGFSQIAAAARDRSEQLLVPRLVGLDAFGIFSAGTLVADRLGNVPDAVCTAFYPRISRAAMETDGRLPHPTVMNMLTVAVAASVPLAIVGTYLAQPLSDILLPAASDACRAVIQTSVWAVPLLAMSHGLSFSLQAVGRHELVARLGLRSSVISAVLAAGLISTLGIEGASWSLLARPAITTMALLPAFRRTFPAVLPGLPLGRILLSASTLAALCVLTDRQRIWSALAMAVCGIGGYGLSLIASRVVPVSAVARLLTRDAPTSA
jgi:O-antigen/teichoic acid export membrane protein